MQASSLVQVPRTAAMAVVRNHFDYLPVFLAHHLRLVDRIYLIDHNSTVDLRGLSTDQVRVVRSNTRAHFQEEFTNTAFRHFRIAQEFDWLFLLDSDEFLPFTSKETVTEFVRRYSRHAVVAMRWRNGFPVAALNNSYVSLLENPDTVIFRRPSGQYKASMNLRKLASRWDVWVTRGNHHVRRTHPLTRFLPMFRNRIEQFIPVIADAPLFHLPSTSPDQLGDKINNFKRLNDLQGAAPGAGGGVHSYPGTYTRQQWLRFVAHYRDRDFDNKPVTLEDLEELRVLRFDGNLARTIASKIANLPPAKDSEQSNSEDEYVALKATLDGWRAPQDWFAIDADEVVLRRPQAD